MKNIKIKSLLFTSLLALTILSGCSGNKENTDTYFHKVIDGLYQVNYKKGLSYDKVNQFFEKTTTTRIFGNSSVYNNGFLGTNTNYYYSEDVQIVVNTSAIGDVHATIGSIGSYDLVNQSFIDSETYKSYLQLLPFFINDGMNDSGVTMNMGSVPAFDLPGYAQSDKEIKTTPSKGIEKTIYGDMLVRYVLDNFASASEAITYISEHVSIITNKYMYNEGYTHHYIIADNTSSYLLEVFGTSFNVVDMGKDSGSKLAGRGIMSDFYETLNDVNFTDGKIIINKDEKPNESGVTPHGKGLERYNYAVKNYSISGNFLGMLSLMHDLKYSQCYNTMELYTEIRYSDYASKTVTNSELVETYQPLIEAAKAKYEKKKKSDGKDGVVITTSCCIYDIAEKELYIDIDEQTSGNRFAL